MPEDLQERYGSIAVLYTGSRHHDGQQQAKRIDEEMAFAAFDLFVCVKAADPPFSVVLTDWLSMRPALGWRCLPEAARTSPRSRSCIRCQLPSWRQIQK